MKKYSGRAYTGSHQGQINLNRQISKQLHEHTSVSLSDRKKQEILKQCLKSVSETKKKKSYKVQLTIAASLFLFITICTKYLLPTHHESEVKQLIFANNNTEKALIKHFDLKTHYSFKYQIQQLDRTIQNAYFENAPKDTLVKLWQARLNLLNEFEYQLTSSDLII